MRCIRKNSTNGPQRDTYLLGTAADRAVPITPHTTPKRNASRIITPTRPNPPATFSNGCNILPSSGVFECPFGTYGSQKMSIMSANTASGRAFAAPPQTAFEKSLENIYFLRLFERTSIKRRYPLLYSSQKRNTPGITVIIGVKIRYPPSARDEKKKLI